MLNTDAHYCDQCGQLIAIAGLDYSQCTNCNWTKSATTTVGDLKASEEYTPITPKKSKRRKSSTDQSNVEQISLFGGM